MLDQSFKSLGSTLSSECLTPESPGDNCSLVDDKEEGQLAMD